MAEQELRKYFHQLMKMVDGLQAIIITDRDGVPVLKVCDENAPELAMRPRFLATAGIAIDQAGKLGVASNKHIVSIYNNYQVVSFNKLPLVVTMIATERANTGAILGLESDMQGILQDIRTAVDVS